MEIAAIIFSLIKLFGPEALEAIKRARQEGVLTDEQIAATEAKRAETLEKMETAAGLHRR